jgi:hypothetical protein
MVATLFSFLYHGNITTPKKKKKKSTLRLVPDLEASLSSTLFALLTEDGLEVSIIYPTEFGVG